MIKKIFYISFIFLFPLLACSCGSKSEEPGASDPAGSLRIRTTIEPKSRALLEGTHFSIGNTCGLFIVNHNSQTSYASSRNNILAKLKNKPDGVTGATWQYCNSEGNDPHNLIYLLPDDPTKTADVYAYAPHIPEAKSIKSIPISLLNKNNTSKIPAEFMDLMWATENQATSDNSEGGNTAFSHTGQNRTATLTFRHALARIVFVIKMAEGHKSIKLSQIAAYPSEGGPSLFYNGNFNAVNGSISGEKEVSRSFPYKVVYGNELTSEATAVYFPLFPVDLGKMGSDVENAPVYCFDFYFNGAKTYTLHTTRGMFRHKLTDNSDGIRAGMTYKFELTLDASLHLGNITITEDWKTENWDFSL